jgi:hypothetical protein
MNFIKLLFVISVINFSAVNAQNVQDVFLKKEMTWFGLDFSKAKFVGDFNEFGPISAGGGVIKVQTGDTTKVLIGRESQAKVIRDTYFRSWNNVVLNEKEKYNLPVFYNKQAVMVDVANIEKVNSNANLDSMMLPWGTLELSKEMINEAVNKYDNKGKSGLGLVFIVESFNKTIDLATIHVTFFDMSSNKVLLSKRIQTKPSGIGLRNYWVSSVHRAMEESKENWKKWKKEAGVK